MQYLGIDLSNTDANLLFVSDGREQKLLLHTELCRDKREDRWYIDAEAYEKAAWYRGCSPRASGTGFWWRRIPNTALWNCWRGF